MSKTESRRDRSDRHLLKGIDLFQMGKIDDAIAQFEKAVEVDAGNECAWNNRGLALKMKGDLDGAVKCYTRAIKIDPNYEEAWYNLGNALAGKKDMERAIRAFDRALEIEPGDMEARANRDWCREELKRMKPAPAPARKASPTQKPAPKSKTPEATRAAPKARPAAAASGGRPVRQPPQRIQREPEEYVQTISGPEEPEEEPAILEPIMEPVEENAEEEVAWRDDVSPAEEEPRQEESTRGTASSSRRAELERQMEELRRRIEEGTRVFEEKRTRIEEDIRDQESEKDHKRREHDEALLRGNIEVETLVLEEDLEKEMAADAGADMPVPRADDDIAEMQSRLRTEEEEARQEIEAYERVVEEKKKEFSEVIRDESEFLRTAREEEEVLRRELEEEVRKMTEHMDDFLKDEGIEF